MKNIVGAVCLIAILLGSCAPSGMKFGPKEIEEFGLKFMSLVQAGDIGAIEAQIDSAVLNADPYLPGKLQKLAKWIPPGKPASVAVVSWRYTEGSRSGGYHTIALQLEFPSRWVLATMVLTSGDGRLTVRDFTLRGLPQSLQQINAFSLRNRPFLNYAFLAYAIWVPCIIAYALILCIRTPVERRKWLWVVFILLGNFGYLTLNWTSGSFSYRVLWVHVPPSSYYSDAYSPVLIASSLPLGALVFLSRRRRGLLSKKGSPTPGQPPAAPPAQGAG